MCGVGRTPNNVDSTDLRRHSNAKLVPNPARRKPRPRMTSWICPSCGLTATARYCGNCGEHRLDDDKPPAAVGKHAAQPAQSFLSRARASLYALLSPPGRLTTHWIRGRRVRYLTPLSLFLWINVVFFLIQSI